MKTNSICARLVSLTGLRAVALLVLAIAVSATTISCAPSVEMKDPPAKEHAGEVPPPTTVRTADVPTAADYKRVARLFGESLLAANYVAAYELTSSRLKQRMSAEKFSEACKKAVEQFGEAVQLGAVVVDQISGLAGPAASQQFGFPGEIPDGDRLAWLHTAMALDVDGEEIIRCYDCWMLLENDGGKARIGHFSFTPCE
jgi:hypothetical protein